MRRPVPHGGLPGAGATPWYWPLGLRPRPHAQPMPHAHTCIHHAMYGDVIVQGLGGGGLCHELGRTPIFSIRFPAACIAHASTPVLQSSLVAGHRYRLGWPRTPRRRLSRRPLHGETRVQIPPLETGTGRSRNQSSYCLLSRVAHDSTLVVGWSVWVGCGSWCSLECRLGSADTAASRTSKLVNDAAWSRVGYPASPSTSHRHPRAIRRSTDARHSL